MSDINVLADRGQSAAFSYRIDYRPAFALATLMLGPDQSIKAESGAMVSMGSNIELESKMEGEASLEVDTGWGGAKSFFASDSMFVLQVRGTGVQFVTSFGALHGRTLAAGETYVVDTGHLVAWHSQMPYQIQKATKSFFRSLTSGEAFVASFTGPGTVLMQTRNLNAFVDVIEPLLPKPSSNSSS